MSFPCSSQGQALRKQESVIMDCPVKHGNDKTTHEIYMHLEERVLTFLRICFIMLLRENLVNTVQ